MLKHRSDKVDYLATHADPFDALPLLNNLHHFRFLFPQTDFGCFPRLRQRKFLVHGLRTNYLFNYLIN
ncbi:hypothetical protein PUN28_016858 [Cardiocondyla obscurior]|uniref:Uncharacterized protein n=1 Tax=Cardiocondyla obscurior TaxID=286306 RepID=A0AAW2EP48_9HYME